MSTTTTTTTARPTPGELRPIVRHYQVTLCPDGDEALAYDPLTVNLSYSEANAAAIDPRSQQAVAEAVKRAIVMERRLHETPAERVFTAQAVRFTRERVSTRC